MEELALAAVRVLNTRAPEDSQQLERQLRELGAEVLSLPATRVGAPDDPAPLDAAIAAITAGSPTAPAFDWIGFTSAHAVSALMDALLGGDRAGAASVHSADVPPPTRPIAALAGIRLAVVGPGTQAALDGYGLQADLVPDRAAGRHLAAAFGDVSGLRILLPRSNVALRDLPHALRTRGALVTEVVAYATRPAPPDPAILAEVTAGRVDAALFFSPSAIDGLAAQLAPRELGETLPKVAAVCVGETTAQAARSRGLVEVVVATEASVAGVVRALAMWRQRTRPDA